MKKNIFTTKRVMLLLIASILFFAPQIHAETDFGKNVRVVDTPILSDLQDYPSIVVDDTSGDIYAVWHDRRNKKYDIYFAKSTNGGLSFGKNIKINDSITGKRFYPSMAIDTNGDLYIVWHDERNGSRNRDIYFTKSTDGGLTFTANVRVDDTGASSSAQCIPDIAVDIAGHIYVTWYDNRNGNPDIYFAKSTDGGATFGANVRVDDTGVSSSAQAKPDITVDKNGDVYIAWHDKRNGNHDIYFSKSTDGGATFGANVRVDDSGSLYRVQIDPSIAVDDSGDIYIAWHDYRRRSHDIYFAKSTDGGATFGTNVRVDSSPLQSFQLNPSLALDAGGNIYVSWHDKRNGNFDIYFTKSTDGGASFGANNTRVDDTGITTSEQRNAALTVDTNGYVYAVWKDSRNGNADIYFAKSTDGGATFGKNVRIVDTNPLTDLQDYPSIVVDNTSGNIYAAWHDKRNKKYDIYFAKSINGGLSFEKNIKINDSIIRRRFYPSLAIDLSGNIYAVWHDERNANRNRDIYFAKSTDGGATFGANVRVDDTGASSSAQCIPSIAIDKNGDIYVAWYDNRGGNPDIYFAKSTDGGATFGANVRVDDTGVSSSAQAKPDITVDKNGDVYIAWHDKRNGNHDIYFSKSTDGGATFGANVRVDDSGSLYRVQIDPSIAVDDSGDIYIAWHDYRRRSHDIYFAKSTDGGATFGVNVRVDRSPSDSFQLDPSLAMDKNGNIHIAWHDKRNDNFDIYFTKSTDSGATFGTNVRVDDTGTTTGEQRNVAITVDSNGHTYAVWKDSRNGNPDIYFAKAENIPVTPTPILPSDGNSLTTLTPFFEWSAFQDGGDGDTQTGYQLRVHRNDNDAVVYNTGFISDISAKDHTYSPGAYTGVEPITGITRISGPLEWGEHYYWHIRYRDSGGQWSDWSKDTPANYQDFYILNPPVLRPVGNRTGNDGQLFIIQKVIATDADGDILTLQANNLPSGARFNHTQSTPGYIEYKVYWPGKFVKTGTYNVTFIASDGSLSDSETISIVISP